MTSPPLDDLAADATLVFRGSIERSNATTMPAVPASESTAVVRIDEVIHAPAALGDLTGSEITVQFSATAPTGPSSQTIYFTRPWLYGDSLAVVEVGRRATDAGDDDTADPRQEIAELMDRQPDQALQRRLTEVQAVVSGQVVNTQPLPGARRVTEHDPGLQVATVAVDSVQMGDPPQPTVDVLFAASNDVLWFESPKLQIGRQGIWLLQRGGAPSTVAAPATAWTCLDPLDELPRADLDRVRGIVEAIGRAP